MAEFAPHTGLPEGMAKDEAAVWLSRSDADAHGRSPRRENALAAPRTESAAGSASNYRRAGRDRRLLHWQKIAGTWFSAIYAALAVTDGMVNGG